MGLLNAQTVSVYYLFKLCYENVCVVFTVTVIHAYRATMSSFWRKGDMCIYKLMTEEEPVQIGDQREPSVSTMLLNFSNEFDPYDALSTPLYQTATFKQVNFRTLILLRYFFSAQNYREIS